MKGLNPRRDTEKQTCPLAAPYRPRSMLLEDQRAKEGEVSIGGTRCTWLSSARTSNASISDDKYSFCVNYDITVVRLLRKGEYAR